MSKPILAVDIDEVLFPFTPTFLAFHNDTYQTQLTIRHKQSDFLELVTGDSEDAMLAKIDAYIKTPHYAASGPIPDAVHVIQRLSQTWRMVIVTARTPNYRGTTELFVARHFPAIEGILYSCDPRDPKKYTPKRDLCIQINARALIDDSLRNLQPLAGTNVAGSAERCTATSPSTLAP